MQSAMSKISTVMFLGFVLSLGADLLLVAGELIFLNEQPVSTFMVTDHGFNGFW